MLVIVGATLSTRFLQGNDILAEATCSLELGIGFFTLLYEVFPIGRREIGLRILMLEYWRGNARYRLE